MRGRYPRGPSEWNALTCYLLGMAVLAVLLSCAFIVTSRSAGAFYTSPIYLPEQTPPCWANPNSKRHPGTCTPTPAVTPTDTPAVPSSTPTSTPTSTPSPPANTPTPSPTPCSPDPHYSCAGRETEYELEVYRIINEYRAAEGKPPFRWVQLLSDVQSEWAERMVAENGCYHGQGPDFFADRAIAAGYQGFAWGEVGACGYPSPLDTVNGWMGSPAHRGIIMECCGMDEIGVGIAYYPNRYTSAWAIVGDGPEGPGAHGSDARTPVAPSAPVRYTLP